jgi:hypothetical protein
MRSAATVRRNQVCAMTTLTGVPPFTADIGDGLSYTP